MKIFNKSIKNACHSNSFKPNGNSILLNQLLLVSILLLTFQLGKAQTVSGTWNSAGVTSSVANSGYVNYGSGVIQLINTTNTGCQGSAVHQTTSTYDPTSGTTFNKCYKVFFGCPGNDDIGNDSKGDGMAFSFSKCAYNITNGNACGGGLGYMGSCSKMITIEFDTWSSQCNNNFDCNYGGGTAGIHDEIALHKDGDASDVGRITSVDAGNLEDGLEHTVCITYTPGTHKLVVTIDGTTMFSYDFTGSPYDLPTYFGAGGLNQTWSSGKFGATNPATVSDGAGIVSTVGAPLCPAGVAITSPTNGAYFSGCSVSALTITADATPPASTYVTKVEFYIDGTLVSTSTNPSTTTNINYTPSYSWPSPTTGSHALTAKAYYSDGSNSSTTSSVNITNGGLTQTATPPVIDGTAEALWGFTSSYTLAQGYNNPPDLAANYKVMYDATNLYVLVNVTDNILVNNGGNIWDNDGIEVYIDYGNTKTTSYNANQFQYAFAYNSAVVTEYKHGATSGVTFSQGALAGGYLMEIKFPWSTLGGAAPTTGSNLGFDVKINDNDKAVAPRDHQLAWNDGTFSEYNNPALFGTLKVTNCTTLPIDLISFTATKTNGDVWLKWITGENKNKNFRIERSTDLTHWLSIGEVISSKNSSDVSFNFKDPSPLANATYYRIVQTDDDGRRTYSKSVEVESMATNILIVPNPFEELFTIELNATKEVTITFFDLSGKAVYSINTEGNNESIIIQPAIPTGSYIIQIQNEEFIEQQMIIKR
jgi:hypothetical protein